MGYWFVRWLERCPRPLAIEFLPGAEGPSIARSPYTVRRGSSRDDDEVTVGLIVDHRFPRSERRVFPPRRRGLLGTPSSREDGSIGGRRDGTRGQRQRGKDSDARSILEARVGRLRSPLRSRGDMLALSPGSIVNWVAIPRSWRVAVLFGVVARQADSRWRFVSDISLFRGWFENGPVGLPYRTFAEFLR